MSSNGRIRCEIFRNSTPEAENLLPGRSPPSRGRSTFCSPRDFSRAVEIIQTATGDPSLNFPIYKWKYTLFIELGFVS